MGWSQRSRREFLGVLSLASSASLQICNIIHCDTLRFRVLDECDEMLNMGFVDDVEKILNAGGSQKIQVLQSPLYPQQGVYHK